MRTIIGTALAVAMLVLAMTAPAVASNARQADAVAVDVTADDIHAATCGDGTVDYYAVDHGLGDAHGAADEIWWRQPATSQGRTVSVGDGTWNTLYLGVSGPECEPLELQGPVTVYYEYDDATYSVRAQFDGQGELVRVNGVPYDG